VENLVTSEIPNYLRLHVEEPADSDQAAQKSTDSFLPFCRSFEHATGWKLILQEVATPEQGRRGLSDQRGLRASVAPPAPTNAGTGDNSSIELPRARALASAFAEVIQQLHQTQLELRRREAELAAGVPVRRRRNEEQHLAIRLEAALKGGAEAVGCHAASLYSLDDATTQLKLRASWGLPVERMMQPPRPLRGAVADLEALIGHAVVLEDTSLLPHWRVPEDFASAVCVPVSSPTEPLGTLWMFCKHARPFSAEQTNLIEIIAGRVASELQREALLRECVSSKQLDRQLSRAAEWQQSRLPNVKPLIDDWQFAGATHHEKLLGAGFFDWFVPPDGSLAVTVGCSDGSMLEAALTTASFQSFLRAHAEHARDPAKLLGLVNESVWSSSTGGQFASIFHASIAPDSGELRCASAGNIRAHLIGVDRVRQLGMPSAPIGTTAAAAASACTETIAAGEVLVATTVAGANQPPSSLEYINVISRMIDKPAEDLAAAVRTSLLMHATGAAHPDWAAVVVKRCREHS
jgi:serine phosphatase RsbU (regulator of sigma subunit)